MESPQNSEMLPRARLYFALILLFGLALRLFDLIQAPAIEMDGVAYARIADHFLRGAFGQGLHDVFSPFYPFFIGLAYFLVHDLEVAGRCVSLIFGMLLICLCYPFFKRMLGEKKALYGAFFVAIHPYLVQYSASVLSESLATFLFVATVLLFYKGFVERKSIPLAFSGFLIALTYLTRPEYIVYYVPFTLLLLARKRIAHTAVFLASPTVLAALYIGYLRLQTGLWIVSNKATMSPFVPLTSGIVNIPIVAYHVCAALFPPFFLLLLIGLRGADREYKVLLISLLVFHILSLSVIGHSTRRYSVEFVPLLLLFSSQGMAVATDFLRKYRHRVLLSSALFLLVLASCLQPRTMALEKKRAVDKQAGLFIRQYGTGRTIAARLPLVSFYSKGQWIQIPDTSCVFQDCATMRTSPQAQKADYFVLDDKLQKLCPELNACLSPFPVMADFKNRDGFIRIYRLTKGDRLPKG
jgi:4-amino-4-deoxy-L-arabinose transferase-like glycosyltransferase